MKKPEPPKDGPITRALIEAVQIRRQFIDAGMSEEEADYRVGQGLKAVLGNQRPAPWRFYCERCRDTGWVNVEPSAEELERITKLYGDPNQTQGYVVKCEPLCKWTLLEREKRRKQSGQDFDPEDDLAGAGQTKPTRGFKRFGR